MSDDYLRDRASADDASTRDAMLATKAAYMTLRAQWLEVGGGLSLSRARAVGEPIIVPWYAVEAECTSRHGGNGGAPQPMPYDLTFLRFFAAHDEDHAQ